MFVQNQMSKNPVTVSPDTGLDVAQNLMKKHKFRRLPVIDDEGALVGFFSDRDLMRVAPSPATTLSKYEITELLADIKVKDIMQKNVFTVSEDATIEEAALQMVLHKIGGLPVVSQVGTVVGIITETDIFRTFVNVMGLADGRTRITVRVENKHGIVRDLSAIFADHGWNIDSLVTAKQPDASYEIVIRTDAEDEDAIKKALTDKGFDVIHTTKISK
ncbi:CBS and ACT domain-containing protein [Selenomonas sp. TAMA-11512]|uniref:CBS and ACT domain-containing protein n=1 Tax=Selenomonas sp. TAMA-11512 TaxID=3095337 RepID=UPI003085BE2C|nr:CBS and ACT domain-containing protein [Selenomonas sp. TAMA-11512]